MLFPRVLLNLINSRYVRFGYFVKFYIDNANKNDKILHCVEHNENQEYTKYEEEIMKRKSLRVFACAAVMAMGLMITACGGDKEAAAETSKTEEAKTEIETELSETEEKKEEAPAAEEKKEEAPAEEEKKEEAPAEEEKKEEASASLEDYFNDPTVKEAFDALKDAMEGSGMSMDIVIEGNKMTYVYTFEEVAKDASVEEQLNAGLDEEAATFEQTAASMEEESGVSGVIVGVEYVDCNGETIVSREFTAK